ncbi:hypothetical protein [Streptomyces sp. NBC_01506]|uniref:hypothetical protein n=1 Tax=Streptomyces sp. NBC_01506 TaxID=2903887 RepID=UPI00386BA729
MPQQPHRREITYTDELLADRTVHRRYSDGGQEWRSAVEGGSRRVVRWRDERGGSGSDELLGRRIVKRVYDNGRRALYGREAGYGRTLWSDGVLTVNRTSFGGKLGTVLGAVTAGAVIGGLAMPPAFLSPEEEEELRRQAEASASGGGGDAGGGDVGYGGWGDGSGDTDDDFG